MKKTTLAFLLSLCCLFGYAQLEEEFEGTTFPPTGWGVYDNGIGTFYSWGKSPLGSNDLPPYQGTTAAFIQRENVTNAVPEDWLITKQFTVPLNGKITFYSRLGVVGDQGGMYQVKVSTDANQATLANYTLMQEWTESQINGVQQREYVKKELNFAPELYGQQVYVAFIMKANFADRWLIDNVSVTENCPNPENLTADNFTTTTAELNWDNPSGATQWEIEIIPSQQIPTGVGQLYTGTLPYTATLQEGTEYKYYVKAICPLGGQSEWAGPTTFKTNRKGDLCSDPIVVNSLPYSNTDDTNLAANYYNGSPGTNCGTFEWGSYLEGNDVIYKYTPTEDKVITIKASSLINDNATMFVYTSCDNIGTDCFAADFNEYSTEDLEISFLNVTAGTTYYILFSTSFNTTPYFLTIQEEHCAIPNQLSATSITTGSANLSWAETGTATAWQYAMLTAGAGIPSGPGIDTTVTTYNPTGLPAGTKYEFYVRSNCGDGTFSSWAGPFKFNTQCNPLATPFNETFNSDSASKYCWTVTDLNNDGRKWNLSDTNSPNEGDQSANFFTNYTADNDDMLISPALTMQPNYRLRYRYKTEGFGGPTHFKVVLSTTGTNPANFTTELLPLTEYEEGSYKTKILDLTAYAGQTIHIAWYIPENGPDGNNIYIDDVFVEVWPACAEPTDLAASNITSASAQVAWIKGHNETAWEIGVKDISQGTLPPAQGDTLIAVGTNPFTVTNLQPNTTYTYYVRAVCGPNNVSQWVGPYTFTTACLPFAVPFFEGFNSDSQTQNCWSIINGNNDWSTWNLDAGYPQPFEGDEFASVFAGLDNINDWLVSPALTLTGNERLKYHYSVGEGGGKFRVMLSTTGKDINDFTEVLVPSAVYDNTGGNGSFLKEIVSLQGHTGPVYIAFHADPPSGGYANINIDNFIVEPIPVCPEPLTLAASTLTQTSAQISWTAGGTETQWEIYVQESGLGLPTGAGIPATSPFTVTAQTNGTPLFAGSTYDVYVRAICAPGVNSQWSDRLKFTTMISNDECANAINVPVNSGTECIVKRWGTTIGATLSPQEQCNEWSMNQDVWFDFVATAEVHTVSFGDLPQSESLEFAVYSGDCGALSSIICPGSTGSDPVLVLKDLVVGQTYKIRVFKYDFMQGVSFSICIKTPVTQIEVSTTQYTVEELVRDVLVGSECSQVSNITFSTGTNFDGPNGIGYFTKNGSNFPFASGLILSTGNAENAPGPNQSIISGQGSEWLGDTDLEQIIEAGTGIPMESQNATVLEFDFIPLRNTISFDFLFASEEYGNFQCEFSDSFAFILTDAQGNEQNLALVPGTSTPISVITIRDELYNDICDSQNVDYFDNYYGPIENGTNNGDLSATNYNGQTVVMQAQGTVVLGQPYHIKMVIADRQDDALDSAVFLGAESFNLGRLSLGTDMLVTDGTAVCENEDIVLDSKLDPEAFIITWTKDNIVIPGESGATLTVTESGTYAISAELLGLSCTTTDSIVIEYYPDFIQSLAQPLNLVECADNSTAQFNIASNTTVILNDLNPDDYTISYHTSADDADTGDNALGTSYENTETPQTIYVRIVNNATTCSDSMEFTISTLPTPQFTLPANFSMCNGSTGTIAVTAVNFDLADATYQWTLDDNALAFNTAAIDITEAGVYKVTVTTATCQTTKEVTVSITPAPVADAPADVEACDVYVLPALSAGNTYHTESGGNGEEFFAGKEILGTQTIYVFAQSGTTPNCTAENSFMVTVNPTPQFTLGGPYRVCLPENVEITVNPSNFDASLATYEWIVNGNSAGTNSSITGTEFGLYEVTVTIGGCFTKQSIMIERDTDAIEAIITDGCESGSYSVIVSDKDGSFNIDTATYEWTGPENFASANREIFPKEIGDYTVTVTTADGCTTQQVFPVVSTICDIPRGVSPNGDTKNDTFDLTTLDVRKLGIFNRYGQEVYTRTNYTNQWHGQGSNGDELPTGTYFYMIERTNGETKTGWVYLNREE